MELTVGQLRKALEGVDDNIKVVVSSRQEWTDWIDREPFVGYTDGSNHTVPKTPEQLEEYIAECLAGDWDEDEQYLRSNFRWEVFTLLADQD